MKSKKQEVKANEWAINFKAWNFTPGGDEWRKLKGGFILTIYETRSKYWWAYKDQHYGPFSSSHLAKIDAYFLLVD